MFQRDEKGAEQKEFFSAHTEFTFADILLSLRMQFDWLQLNGGKVAATMVVQPCNWNIKYGIAFIKQTAQTAMSLPQLISNITWEIAYQESRNLCSS